MLIAVLGPDGSGKTTLARSLAENNDQIDYVYLGHNLEQRVYRWGDDFIKSKWSMAWPIKPFRRFLITLNDWLEYMAARGNIRVSDRYIIDALIGTRLFRKKMRFYYNIILRFFPKPDLVILLDGDGKKIWERKQELTPEIIDRYISSYKEYLTRNGVRFRTINTIENSLEQSNKIALEYILEH
ncbi:MAG: hypothetical protein KDC12_10620 [Flavobacteriales bacterium]|nr:hypothetical protein [Flavobacteriales bacterium]